MEDIPVNKPGETTPPSPAAAPDAGPSRAAATRRSRITPAARVLAWAIVLGLGLYAYGRMTRFGTRVVQSHPVDARIEIANPPAWLDRSIVNAMLDEAYRFASRDMDTYNRSRNVLDSSILKEFANLYTGTSSQNGQTIAHQAIGYNAWISKVTQVRRAVGETEDVQTIQIFAEWRQPVAWVRVFKSGEPFLYLMDAQGTRLPGEYRAADRGKSPLMVIGGIELPKISGQAGIPAPGETWFANGAAMGEDLAAGLNLASLLQTQKFAPQIAAIDMTNYGGRINDRTPWIVLETIYPTATGAPRLVQWGRGIGQEKYYEVQATAKVKTLKDLNAKFGRIDAGRDYVDIRSDVVRLPKVDVQAASASAGRG